jgi:hypothetical protein
MTETAEHRLLRELAAVWLRGRGCKEIAFEVFVHGFNHRYQGGVAKRYRYVADVVGASVRYRPYETGVPSESRRFYDIWCVEAKVSRSDFEAGFVYDGANRSYLITLPNLVDPKELPAQVGLIEVDPDNFQVLGWNKRIPPTPTVHGMVIRKNARYREIDQSTVESTRRRIADRASASLIYTLLGKYSPYSSSSETGTH